jgi:hypothetical protein
MFSIKKMLRFLVSGLFAVILLSAIPAVDYSQALTPSTTQQNWERYTVDGEEFTVLLPELPSGLFLGTGTPGYRYAAYGDGIVYIITSEVAFGPRNIHTEINNQKVNLPENALTFKRDVTRDKFTGKEFSVRWKNAEGAMAVYVTKEHVYVLRAVGADESHTAVRQFLDSFTLGKKPQARDIGNGARLADEAQVQSPEPIYKEEQVTQKATMVIRGPFLPTEKAIKNKTAGTVIIDAVLRYSGKVTDIKVISGLPDGLTEIAVIAARKAYFIPAVKDGRRVSQYYQFRYTIPASLYPAESK